MTLDSCSLCHVLVSGFVLWFLVFDFHVFVSCLAVSYVLIFHAFMCPLSVSYVLPSVCQCSHPCLTTSPVPRLFISVCVFSLYVPFTPCPVIVFCLYVALCVQAPVHVLVHVLPVSLSPHGMCSLNFDFWFSDVWFELWFFSLYFELFYLPLCLAVSLLPWFLVLGISCSLGFFVLLFFLWTSPLNKARLLFTPYPWVTAFGSTLLYP